MLCRIAYFFLLLTISCAHHQNEEIVRLGNYKNRPRGFQSVYMPGGQIALYIPNTLKAQSKVNCVRFYIGEKGDFKKPFGVKLYSHDSLTGKPDVELLKVPVIVNNVEKNGWYAINLDGYNLDFPKNGIFVSMEWIPDDDFNELSQSECQYLAYSRMENENNTWYCALGINWYQLPNVILNAMISIDVKKRGLDKAN